MKDIKIVGGPSNDELFDSLRFSDKNRVEFIVKLEDGTKEKIGVRIICIEVAHCNDGRIDDNTTVLLDDEDSLPLRRYKWTIKMFIRERYNIRIDVIPSDEWIEHTANYSTLTKRGSIKMSENMKRLF